MDEMRIMLLGVGNFGISWAQHILPACAGVARLVAAVDRDSARLEILPADIGKYTDLDEALSLVHPDLVINATQPDAHLPTNLLLLNRGFPVLCEKPLSDSMEAAEETGKMAAETKGFLMIGENYRYGTVIRTAKQFLNSGALGTIHRMNCLFRHEHKDFSMFYHGRLRHPLLEDVTIHHLDLARYLSGQEPKRVTCREYAAPYSWYGERLASADLWTDMTNDVAFSYSGTLASPVTTTPWNGNWEIECQCGVLQIMDDRLFTVGIHGRTEVNIEMPEKESRAVMLKEACAALREGRKGETDYSDNIKSFHWMRSAIEASEKNKAIEL